MNTYALKHDPYNTSYYRDGLLVAVVFHAPGSRRWNIHCAHDNGMNPIVVRTETAMVDTVNGLWN